MTKMKVQRYIVWIFSCKIHGISTKVPNDDGDGMDELWYPAPPDCTADMETCVDECPTNMIDAVAFSVCTKLKTKKEVYKAMTQQRAGFAIDEFTMVKE